MKPKIFIGSSREALPAAEAVQRELSHACEPILWTQGVFRETNAPIEDLMKAVDQFDFAVFVFFPEDTIDVRGARQLAVRDNVLFELGLFLGKLGRSRNFFITPKESGTLHLPSDLSGITPAKYDARSSNLQAAVGTALYQLKDAIRTLGTMKPPETVLYDSRADFKQYHFEHSNGYIWGKDNKAITGKGEGTLEFLTDSVLKITRKNTEGRNELALRPNGPKLPSFPKKHEISYRILHISCNARAEGAEHTLRFVAKDIAAEKWIDSRKTKLTPADWAEVNEYLRVPTTSDVLFRIDDEAVSAAPSSVFIKNLKITEES